MAKLVLALTGLLGAYALLGFEIAPRVLRAQLINFAEESYGRRLSIGRVRVNPFKLWVELNDVGLPDDDGKVLFKLRRFFVDFEAPRSLWERAFVFRAISLDGPEARLVVRPDGALNLADLAGRQEPKAEKSSLPSLWIESLVVDAGKLDFIDRSRVRPFERSVSPLAFSVRNFRTTPAGGDFGLTANLNEGARLEWNGKVAIAPQFASSGKLALSGFSLATLGEYLGNQVPFLIATGALDLRGTYQFRSGASTQLDVALPTIAVRDLALRARDQSASVEAANIELTETKLALASHALELAGVRIQKLTTRAIREPDGSFNLAHMLAARPAQADDPTTRSEAPWSAKIHTFELAEAAVQFEDRGPAEGAKIKLAPIDATVQDLSLDLAQPLAVTASIGLPSGGRVRANGSVTPQPLAAELAVHADAVALALAQPYVVERAGLTIEDGRVELQGKLALDTQLSFTGDLTFNNLRTVDNVLHQDFIAFEQLALKQLKYESQPASLDIGRIDLRKPYARVVLSADQHLNVVSVLAPPPAAKTAPPAQSVATPAEPALAIQVHEVGVDRMRMNFSDYFSKPHFAADMQQLSGTLSNLSSDPKSSAKVDLKGSFGANGSVVIAGKLQPFAYDKLTDIKLQFANIALPIFNPYSGRYAGYNISRGELATDIHYVLKARKLAATHKLRIDQLTWGEATPTKAQAPLPVKLATALLRDRHGVINLDIPVEGTLDDPAFRVWPLIWQVVGNILVKAATAPFDLLASLFAGSEEAKFIDFDPGSAELSPQARKALGALAKALSERPQLMVDVPVQAIPQLDRSALLERKYQFRLAESMRAKFKRKRDGVPSFDTLEHDDQVDLLLDLYKELTGKKISVPDAPKPPPGTEKKRAKALEQQFEIDYLQRAARSKIVISTDDLAQLGRRRGEVIDATLVNAGQLDSTRVLLSTESKVMPDHGKVRFQLDLH